MSAFYLRDDAGFNAILIYGVLRVEPKGTLTDIAMCVLQTHQLKAYVLCMYLVMYAWLDIYVYMHT